MNHLLIGIADKTERLLDLVDGKFLLIDDGPIADVFLAKFPKAKLFDITEHRFNPLSGIDYKRARDFAAAVYTASPEGESTLTVRNGKRALVKLLLESRRLDRLPPPGKDPGLIEATNTVDDLLLSPILKQVLCNTSNFHFNRSVVVKLDRAEVGDFDAFVLGSLLVGQSKGPIILPDFGFYGRAFHTSLIRQNRLTAGVNSLSELSEPLQQAVLLIQDKTAQHCTWEDAQTLASYASLKPDTVGYTEFVQGLME